MSMAANIGNGRILRVCDLCGGVDDHPRHVIAGTVPDQFAAPSDEIVNKVLDACPSRTEAERAERGRLLRELQDTSSSDRHLDCCAAAGCPDGTCELQTTGADGKTGKKMLDHVLGLDDPFTDRPNVVKGE